MQNKNNWIVQILFALIFLTISLFLGYLKSIAYLNQYSIKLSIYLYQTRIKTKQTIYNIKNSFESVIQATKYKRLYLTKTAKLQLCQTQLKQLKEKCTARNKKRANKAWQILTINWPEYGYIVLKTGGNYYHNPLKTDNQISANSLITDANLNFVGIVSETYKYFSIAKTLFCPDIKLGVYIKESKAYGVLYNQSGELIIKDISILHRIKVGYHVYLLNSRYPTNILLGTIIGISRIPQNATQEARLKPIYNLNDLFFLNNIKIIPAVNDQ